MADVAPQARAHKREGEGFAVSKQSSSNTRDAATHPCTYAALAACILAANGNQVPAQRMCPQRHPLRHSKTEPGAQSIRQGNK